MKDFYCINKSGGTTTKRCNNQCGECRVIVENRQSRTRNMSLQEDGDLWDEAEHDLKRMNKGRIRPMGWKDIREYLKNNYQLIKRK